MNSAMAAASDRFFERFRNFGVKPRAGLGRYLDQTPPIQQDMRFMTQSTRFIAFALTAGLCASATSAQHELGGFEAAKEVELTTVRANPQAFKNVWIKFSGTYLGLGAVHNPFFTRFTRAEFANFAAWDNDQQIWKQKEYDRACSTLFAEKKNAKLLDSLYSLQRYQRIMMTGVVRNAWQGDPWIEVTQIDTIDEPRITSASLTHMNRGYQLIEQRKWAQAAIEFNLASSKTLTTEARGWMHGYLGLCQMRLGRPESALTQLDAAKTLIPTSDVIDEWLTQVRVNPGSAIDTSSRVTSIRRGDRPMWEAVEEAPKAQDDMKRGGLRNRATPIGATPGGSTGTTPNTDNGTSNQENNDSSKAGNSTSNESGQKKTSNEESSSSK